MTISSECVKKADIPGPTLDFQNQIPHFNKNTQGFICTQSLEKLCRKVFSPSPPSQTACQDFQLSADLP